MIVKLIFFFIILYNYDVIGQNYNDMLVIPQQRRDRLIYVIGDLHGDVNCAKYWVDRIGVVDDVNNPKTWNHSNTSLIFMGDYIDRGPFSHPTLMFVKSLTDAFPNRVTALMGNHELEILKDRHPSRKMKYFYQPFNVIHPNEYIHHVNTTRTWDDDDELVIDLLLNASLWVYSERKNNKDSTVFFTPDRLPKNIARNQNHKCVVDFVEDEEKKPLVRRRLAEYQDAYLASYMSNTTLGKWIESTLKIIHIENGIIFTHGGLQRETAKQLRTKFHGNIDKFHQEVRNNLRDNAFFPFIVQNPTGRMVENLVYYRGNHEDGACSDLWSTLNFWGGIHALAVGHTPEIHIRRKCDDQFLALDSLLGRWIRSSGGMHCSSKGPRSRGDFHCPPIITKCRGQIIKILPDGNMEILKTIEGEMVKSNPSLF